MRLFWQKGRKIRSTERFKTIAIFNARFRENYLKLKVNGRAVTSQTDKQQNVEVGSVSIWQPTWKHFHFESPGMKLHFSSWAFVYFPLVIFLEPFQVRGVSIFFFVFSFHNRLDLITEPAFYWAFYFIFPV